MKFIPSEVFLTKGVGRHRNKLLSYENALREAGIEDQNLVYVSSILPSDCRLVSARSGKKKLSSGEVTCCVLSRNSTCENKRLTGSAIGIAFPEDGSHHGYISEHHDFGINGNDIAGFAENLALTMLSQGIGQSFDPEREFDEKHQAYSMHRTVLKSTSIACTAEGLEGVWTTVISAAVFLS